MLLVTLFACQKQAPEAAVQEPSCAVPTAPGFLNSGGVATWTGDLNGDGRGDRIVRGAVQTWQGGLTDVVLSCRDGDRKLLELKAKEINVLDQRFYGWLVLDVVKGVDSDEVRVSGPHAFSSSAGAYVPGLQAARAAGCPVWGHGVESLVVEGAAATLGDVEHDVAWTGDLDGNAHMDWILTESGSFSPTGTQYRVIAGCPDGHGAVVLEGEFVDLVPDYDSADTFARLLGKQSDGAGGVVESVLAMTSEAEGVYQTIEE